MVGEDRGTPYFTWQFDHVTGHWRAEMAKTKKKKAKKKEPVPATQELVEDLRGLSPVAVYPGELFDVTAGAQEALDRLGTAVPSVKSDGEVVWWISVSDYQAIEYRLTRIIDG